PALPRPQHRHRGRPAARAKRRPPLEGTPVRRRRRRDSRLLEVGRSDSVQSRVDDYRSAAALREALRRFSRHSERVAREEGLTPQQYLLLLMIRGAPDGLERATVTDLAERLQLTQSTVTE